MSLNNGESTAVLAAQTSDIQILIRPGLSRLSRILVTADATAATTFYDTDTAAHAEAGTGTVIAIVPATAKAGAQIEVQMPVGLNIWADCENGSPSMTLVLDEAGASL